MDKLIKRLPYLAYALPFFWLLAIVFVLNFTSPLALGPAGILLVFGVFYAAINSLLFAGLYFFSYVVRRLTKKQLSVRKAYYIASVLALGPVFMMALNTLGQLGVVEVLLVVVLLVTACFYVVRRSESN